jgi:uncharacterized membrane protein
MSARSHPVSRLEAFSDAVFAFALTLIVVSLEVPGNMNELLKLMSGFMPFAVTFAMICYLWYEHNKFFRRYGLEDPLTVFLNSILLFVVLFYVYPLKYLTSSLLGDAEMSSGRLLMYLYSGGVVLVFGTFILLYLRAWARREQLQLDAADVLTWRYNLRAHLISAGIGAASLAIVFLGGQPAIAGFIYFLMGPVHGWNGYMAHKAHVKLEVGSQKLERLERERV